MRTQGKIEDMLVTRIITRCGGVVLVTTFGPQFMVEEPDEDSSGYFTSVQLENGQFEFDVRRARSSRAARRNHSAMVAEWSKK